MFLNTKALLLCRGTHERGNSTCVVYSRLVVPTKLSPPSWGISTAMVLSMCGAVGARFGGSQLILLVHVYADRYKDSSIPTRVTETSAVSPHVATE